jgi:hypothetical protein
MISNPSISIFVLCCTICVLQLFTLNSEQDQQLKNNNDRSFSADRQLQHQHERVGDVLRLQEAPVPQQPTHESGRCSRLLGGLARLPLGILHHIHSRVPRHQFRKTGKEKQIPIFINMFWIDFLSFYI